MRRNVHLKDVFRYHFASYGHRGIYIAVTLLCTRCGRIQTETDPPHRDKHSAVHDYLDRIKWVGWRVEGDELLCPACVASRGQELSKVWAAFFSRALHRPADYRFA